MPSYLHPGVYVEEIPSGSKPIEGVGTSTAAFIGYTTKGPVGEPRLITKWGDYDDEYNGVRNLLKEKIGDSMGLSVAAFFQNGGKKAYIVRITEDIEKDDPGANRAEKAVGYVDHPLDVGKKALKFSAINEGDWGNEIVVRIEKSKIDENFFDVKVNIEKKSSDGNVSVTEKETFSMVSLDESSNLFIKNIIDDASNLVSVDLVNDVTSLNIASDQYLGTSISGELKDISLDFSALSPTKRKIKITIDDEGEETITLDQLSFRDLSSLAAHIQSKVNDIDTNKECFAKFSCEAKNDKLVLTSGSRKSTSSVKVVSDYNMGITLKLGIATDSYLGTSTSGDLNGFGGIDLTGETDPAARSLTVSIDGSSPSAFDFGQANFNDLAAVAGKIDGIDGLSCAVVNNRLVLTSDSRKSTSSVVISSDSGLAPALKLGINPINHGGEELTGQGSHEKNMTTGTSTSGELNGFGGIDLTGVADQTARSLAVSIDGAPSAMFDFGQANIATLNDVMTKINDPMTGIAGLSCAVVDHRLKLTSDSRKSTSSVVVISNIGLAPTFKLGVNPVNHGGEEQTGRQNHDLNYRTQLTGQENADSVIPKDQLGGGKNGGVPTLSDYEKVFKKFIKYRDINMICLPGQYWSTDSSGNPVIEKAISHAERMKNRMVIVDPPPGHELENAKMVNDMGLPSQTYSVVYYPWVEVANRFYHAERNPGLPKKVLVPPSGYAAGMWAKIDGKRGVWKAPAGMETGLLGLAGLEHKVEDDDQDFLNPWGINCLRSIPGAGKVIWGARTRATKADPEWRYVPVRRTAIFIEQSIYNGIQWAVFEPNDHRLWSALRANIGNFMNGLFRVGAFQGEKASDAYFVRCGLGDTMTQGEIDAGQVIVIVGFAPLKPAEFVIVRIQQKVNQQ